MPRYNPKIVEPKWQEFWLKNKTFKAVKPSSSGAGSSAAPSATKPKYYALDMFPYPSANGLHVGHPEGMTATDIVCRYKRMRGFNVLHPMGWDAFGLPAEQHAIKTGTHPAITTQSNIDNFRRQIRSLGFSYDWDREISTADPKYFKWTQWIFKQLFESFYDFAADKARPISELPIPAHVQAQGESAVRKYRDSHRLAYVSEVPVWWCQELGTVLANEEVSDGKSERGSFPCERKPLKQWVLRITAYAERLIRDLDGLEWPESIKIMQRNWIGKSTGAEVKFQIQGGGELSIFTTRPDTLFGATYMVVAPEHSQLDGFASADCKAAVLEYRRQASAKSDLERGLDKDKSGVFTGAYAINPVNGKAIPIWTSDYVMMGYGTGAIMAVPAHDTRDHAFAKTFGLPIIEVIHGVNADGSGTSVSDAAYTGDGKLVNSNFLDGLNVDAAEARIIAWLEEKNLGRARVQFKLRDWLFSRQRYWGEPFPLVHTPEGVVSVPDRDLPVTLPDMQDYKPTGTFEPPLAKAKAWSDYQGPGPAGRRELNTMPQWAGSSWYFLRYLDPDNDQAPFSKDAENYWMPVDLYIGGAEHAVLHLLYARFWHKFLFDMGYVSQTEPFAKLVNQGLILGEDGEKMSKSRGNVVNPDDVIERYGADSMRLYEMFMGPLERQKPWQTAGIEGLWRFLNKVWRLTVGDDRMDVKIVAAEPSAQMIKRGHQTIKKVTEDIDSLRFNTAISQLMIYTGELAEEAEKAGSDGAGGTVGLPRWSAETLVKLVAPFAPHLAEEIWEILGHLESLTYVPWPEWREELTVENTVNVVFQTNGKVRVEQAVAKGTSREALENLARANAKFQPYLENAEVVKVIVVPDKLVNFVVKPR